MKPGFYHAQRSKLTFVICGQGPHWLDTPPEMLYSIPVQIREVAMTIHINYTQARANLAKLLDKVTLNRDIVIIQRRGGEDVALISADELSGLLETAYLLRSPRNAARLLAALGRALKDTPGPQSVEELRREVGLDQEGA